MKRWIGLALVVFVGTAGWRIGDSLSPDALSMAVGVLFGVMAGVPTALLVMAGSRRRNREEHDAELRPRGQPHALALHGRMNGWGMQPYGIPSYAQQPPVIVVAGPQGAAGAFNPPAQSAAWMEDHPARHFTVVGEREELLEEW